MEFGLSIVQTRILAHFYNNAWLLTSETVRLHSKPGICWVLTKPSSVPSFSTEKERGYLWFVEYAKAILRDFPTQVLTASKLSHFLQENSSVVATMKEEEKAVTVPSKDAPLDDLLDYYIFLLRYGS